METAQGSEMRLALLSIAIIGVASTGALAHKHQGWGCHKHTYHEGNWSWWENPMGFRVDCGPQY